MAEGVNWGEWGQGLLGNPMLNMGLGILANNRGLTKGAAFGNAMQGGLLSAQNAQQMQAMMAMRQMQAEKLKREQEDDAAIEAAISQLPPDEQAIARLNKAKYAEAKIKSRYDTESGLKVVGPGAQVVFPDPTSPHGVRVAHTNPYAYRFLETPYGVGQFDPNPGRGGAVGSPYSAPGAPGRPPAGGMPPDDGYGLAVTGPVQPPAQPGQPQMSPVPPGRPGVVMPWDPQTLKGQEALGKKEGEAIGDYKAKVLSEADAASTADRDLDIFELYLKDTYQGSMSGLALAGGRLARWAGYDPTGLGLPEPAPMEAVKMLTNKTALFFRNPESGFGLPGATSDADREFLLEMAPSIRNTRGGNQLMIAGNRAANAHKRKLAEFVDSYQGDPKKLRATVREWAKTNSTIKEDLLARLPHVESPTAVRAMVSSGVLKSGDVFVDSKGKIRVVP